MSKKKATFNKVKAPISGDLKKQKRKKRIIITVIIILLLAAIGGGVAVYLIFFHQWPEAEVTEEIIIEDNSVHYYSNLSGLEIASESENSMPTYCIQIPNGADGARPQTGLNEAPVVFEAIAEAGITRFAAVFQNPKSAAIGPIRSLRDYYLDWDTPFDCTIVHAGGSPAALAALNSGTYRDLSESTTYMWRDYSSYWAPNNLMTSAALLERFNIDNGYTTSNPKTFSRLKPADAKVIAAKNVAASEPPATDDGTSENTAESAVVPLISEIAVNFGSVSTFNTVYRYDIATNTYPRSYASGEEHLVYSCDDVDSATPTPKSDCGLARQIAPSAIAVMMVDERLDTDNYHHVIQTIGTGIAYVFQNGTAIKGTWKKTAQSAQIEFNDADGNLISFTPGQLWIAAVPNYGGSVRY